MDNTLETIGSIVALGVTAGIAMKTYDYISESMKNTGKKTNKKSAKNTDDYMKKLIYG